MFRKKIPTPQPSTVDGETFDPAAMRDIVFETLAKRVGDPNAAVMRADFDHHIAEDPINGVEVAYMCLMGKMIDTVDRISDMLDDHTGYRGKTETVSPFTMFRKDG